MIDKENLKEILIIRDHIVDKENLKEIIKITFRSNLQELMSKRKVSQKELAKELKVSLNAISNYYNGKAFPSIENLYILCVYFKIPIDCFLPTYVD